MKRQFLREILGIIIIVAVTYFWIILRYYIHYKVWDLNIFNKENYDETVLIVVLLILSIIIRNIFFKRKRN